MLALATVTASIALSCTSHCPDDPCPGTYDLGAVCTSRGLCTAGSGVPTCEYDHIPSGAPNTCDLPNLAPKTLVTVNVESLWPELGTRNDFTVVYGTSVVDPPGTASAWRVRFDDQDASCACGEYGCECDNVPSSVQTITIQLSVACPYLSLLFLDRDCHHPSCDR